MLTQRELKEALNYDPTTGIFTWAAPRPRVVVGARAGSLHHTGYRYLTINGRSYPEHHLAWLYTTGQFPENEIDHRNRVRSDNRRKNLRPATRKQNNENAGVRSDCTSGIRGVCWSAAKGKWRAYIFHNKKMHSLGMFDDKEAARAARSAAEMIYFTHRVEN